MCVWPWSIWNVGQTRRNIQKLNKSSVQDAWEDASEPLMWSPFPHSSYTLGRSLIKQNSWYGSTWRTTTPGYHQLRTVLNSCQCVFFPPPRLLHLTVFFFFRILIFSVLCTCTQSSILCSMTLAFVAGNQKEWESVLSFTNMTCIVSQW